MAWNNVYFYALSNEAYFTKGSIGSKIIDFCPPRFQIGTQCSRLTIGHDLPAARSVPAGQQVLVKYVMSVYNIPPQALLSAAESPAELPL